MPQSPMRRRSRPKKTNNINNDGEAEPNSMFYQNTLGDESSPDSSTTKSGSAGSTSSSGGSDEDDETTTSSGSSSSGSTSDSSSSDSSSDSGSDDSSSEEEEEESAKHDKKQHHHHHDKHKKQLETLANEEQLGRTAITAQEESNNDGEGPEKGRTQIVRLAAESEEQLLLEEKRKKQEAEELEEQQKLREVEAAKARGELEEAETSARDSILAGEATGMESIVAQSSSSKQTAEEKQTERIAAENARKELDKAHKKQQTELTENEEPQFRLVVEDLELDDRVDLREAFVEKLAAAEEATSCRLKAEEAQKKIWAEKEEADRQKKEQQQKLLEKQQREKEERHAAIAQSLKQLEGDEEPSSRRTIVDEEESSARAAIVENSNKRLASLKAKAEKEKKDEEEQAKKKAEKERQEAQQKEEQEDAKKRAPSYSASVSGSSRSPSTTPSPSSSRVSSSSRSPTHSPSRSSPSTSRRSSRRRSSAAPPPDALQPSQLQVEERERLPSLNGSWSCSPSPSKQQPKSSSIKKEKKSTPSREKIRASSRSNSSYSPSNSSYSRSPSSRSQSYSRSTSRSSSYSSRSRRSSSSRSFSSSGSSYYSAQLAATQRSVMAASNRNNELDETSSMQRQHPAYNSSFTNIDNGDAASSCGGWEARAMRRIAQRNQDRQDANKILKPQRPFSAYMCTVRTRRAKVQRDLLQHYDQDMKVAAAASKRDQELIELAVQEAIRSEEEERKKHRVGQPSPRLYKKPSKEQKEKDAQPAATSRRPSTAGAPRRPSTAPQGRQAPRSRAGSQATARLSKPPAGGGAQLRAQQKAIAEQDKLSQTPKPIRRSEFVKRFYTDGVKGKNAAAQSARRKHIDKKEKEEQERREARVRRVQKNARDDEKALASDGKLTADGQDMLVQRLGVQYVNLQEKNKEVLIKKLAPAPPKQRSTLTARESADRLYEAPFRHQQRNLDALTTKLIKEADARRVHHGKTVSQATWNDILDRNYTKPLAEDHHHHHHHHHQEDRSSRRTRSKSPQ